MDYERQVTLMTLLGWFLQYFLIFLILVAIALAGFSVGKLLRNRKDAKMAMSALDDAKKEE